MTASKQPQQEKNYCEHWVVCKHAHALLYCPVDATGKHHHECEYDTRTHSSQPVPDALSKENITISAVCGYEAGLEAGAKAERERVLKPLVAWLKQKRKNYGACGDRTANDDPEDCDPYDTVLRRVESLRQQEEQR